jgi:hypothetical protein
MKRSEQWPWRVFLVGYYAVKPGTRLYCSTCDKICILWLIINLYLHDDIDGLSVRVTSRVASGWWQWRWGHGADGWRFIIRVRNHIPINRITSDNWNLVFLLRSQNTAILQRFYSEILFRLVAYLLPRLGIWKIRVVGYDLWLCLTSQITVLSWPIPNCAELHLIRGDMSTKRLG